MISTATEALALSNSWYACVKSEKPISIVGSRRGRPLSLAIRWTKFEPLTIRH